jgi:hypothetical protein
MSGEVGSADWLFLASGADYYISGRYAVFAQLSPVCANLLHHAIEMFMKAALDRTMDLTALKKTGPSFAKHLGGVPAGISEHAAPAVDQRN